MKKTIGFKKTIIVLLVALLMGTILPLTASAEGEDATETANDAKVQTGGTSISLMPVSKVLSLSAHSEYEDAITVNNDGDEEIEIEVFAAPYSYVYSEAERMYKLGFNTETNFTQIVRWISFQKSDGEWDKRVEYKIPAHESVSVKYKIATPESIPAGGQYAVIFAHTLTGVISASGIKTEASPGMVLFGRSTEGEVKVAAQISDMKTQYGPFGDDTQKSYFYGSAKVKNDGNVDFNAVGTLKVEPILGFGSYETPSNKGRVSVIPEAELEVSDKWEESPAFGLYKATWTVKAGEQTETVESIVFVNPILAIIIVIIVLTIITIWIIMLTRRRRDRRSRLAV